MLYKSFFFVSSTLLIFLTLMFFNCGVENDIYSQSYKIENKNQESSKTIQLYWNYSKNGEFDKVQEVISTAPDIFFQCYVETPDECEEKLEKIKQDNGDSSNKLIGETEPNFIISERIPSGIHKEFWKSFSILDQSENDSQARVRVLIQGAGFVLKRDFLLYKDADTWKIFAMVEENLHEAYAPLTQ